MNLLLQDPFSILKEYPDKLVQTISNPLRSTSLQFSRRGDYLATGCLNGTIIIYDMDTLRPITILGGNQAGHVRGVQAIEWDNDRGQYLLSCSRDMSIKIWNLEDVGSNHANVTACGEIWFESAVWNCQWVGSSSNCCVASVFEEESAFLIDLEYKDGTVIGSTNTPLVIDYNDGEDDVDRGHVLFSTVHPKHRDIIITGSSKGWVNFIKINPINNNNNNNNNNNSEEESRYELIYSFKVANSNVKHIIMSENGDRLAINSSDRTIRQYSVSIIKDDQNSKFNVELDLENKYQDVINRLQWNSIFFSNNSGEYLVASPHGSSTHELYLWETSSGSLVRVLEGAEEELMDIDWNFYNMSIVSNGLETGDIYVWSIVIPPKWSALAPDFEEVEENIDYREKEDEFDQVAIDQQQKYLMNQAEEISIDLRTEEKFDVRGNDLTRKQFVIPTDYQRIIMMQQNREE